MVYEEKSVDTPPRRIPGGPRVHYPDDLRRSGVKGVVRAEFVVRTDGNVATESVRIVDSDHPAFSDEVVRYLGTARFDPGTVNGRSVDVLLPFVFMFGRS